MSSKPTVEIRCEVCGEKRATAIADGVCVLCRSKEQEPEFLEDCFIEAAHRSRQRFETLFSLAFERKP